jgi:hypothetical protein
MVSICGMEAAPSVRLILLAAVLCTSATPALACQCGSAYRGKTPWDLAKLEADGTGAIFEGVPVRFDLQWGGLAAKDGELIPSDFPIQNAGDWPRMIVTFRVQKAYKGNLGPDVEIVTGLGGGDCGAHYETGLTYLVYAASNGSQKLGVSMCSPGGWIASSRVAADLRYLRGEHPIPADLRPSRSAWTKETPDQEKQGLREHEDEKKRFESSAGVVCGGVVQGAAKDNLRGQVSFLSTAGYSPVDHPISQVSVDGSFCSPRLRPGKYYLYFTSFSDRGLTAATFYPGVSERANATAIEAGAGQEQSNLRFTVPPQRMHSVRGFISIDDKSGIGPNDVSVSLVSVDADRQTWYRERVDFSGSLPPPRVRFFDFDGVPPGHYVGFASAPTPGWLTKKVDVDVSTHMKFISLELVHKH